MDTKKPARHHDATFGDLDLTYIPPVASTSIPTARNRKERRAEQKRARLTAHLRGGAHGFDVDTVMQRMPTFVQVIGPFQSAVYGLTDICERAESSSHAIPHCVIGITSRGTFRLHWLGLIPEVADYIYRQLDEVYVPITGVLEMSESPQCIVHDDCAETRVLGEECWRRAHHR